MSDRSKIEWCDTTWNPITGCTKISQGCKNCYASELHNRRHKAYLAGAKLPVQYAKPFETVQLHPERLEMPLHWKKPRRIFVNSTSDLFHEDVPDGFVFGTFMRMSKAQQHTFIILTKRADRMQRWITERWMTDVYGQFHSDLMLDNVWLLVSVENQDAADLRIPYLLQTPAAVRGVSGEPLLGPVDLTPYLYGWHSDLRPVEKDPGIDWIICGGESGPGARPMHPDWARSLRDQCSQAGVPYFLKQWGEWLPYDVATPEQKESRAIGRSCLAGDGKSGEIDFWLKMGKVKSGRLLDGVEWNEYPEVGDERN